MPNQRYKYYNFNFSGDEKFGEEEYFGTEIEFILNPSNTIGFPTDSPHRKWFFKMTYFCMEYPSSFNTDANTVVITFNEISIKNSYTGNSGDASKIVLLLPKNTINENSHEDPSHEEQLLSYGPFSFPSTSDMGFEIDYPTFLENNSVLTVSISDNQSPGESFTLVADDRVQIGFTVTCVEQDTPGYLEQTYDNTNK
jgi:hypothetical protein